ncbi:SspB-related isopeptide-forming adhesin [Ligilactobacillus salivarius]|uniref:SspB-related isopeptide-forming adhesin n=1 Tax=Ligilactobacillus salivarius TaxID=1624 RepID=UPI000BB01A03|nr:SspB-related isopeptide-forming adhesin [Ligilactobacillus salivarius]
MTETKLHYKLYKTKHGWVTATIAATALAIPVIGGSVTNHASADTTATTGTQTVTSGSNAVTATTASTTSVTPSNQAVTPDSSKLDQAVQNAKATANVTVNQTPTQTVTGSTVAEAKQKAEQDYQNQATQINQKVANQKANNDATNAANSFNIDNSKKRELDQAVQNAKATANVSVKQTQTQIYNTGVSGVENTKNKINNDYSTQINNINQAVSTQKAKNDAYNKAVAEANTLNSTADTTRKKLDDAIKAAQAVKGVTVIDGGTTTATVSVSDFEAKKKQIQDQNTQQANSINAQIQQYKKEYTKYEKEYNDYLASLKNKSTIESNVVWQNLFLNFGQGANLSVQWNAKPIETHQNQDPDAVVTLKKNLEYNAVFKGSQKGTVATATWLMPEGSAYYKSLDGTKETRIAKIVSVISNVVASGDNSNRVIIGFYNNPMIHAFSSFANSVDETFYFYDDTGKLIDFKDGTAWLGLASLNHFGAPRDIKEEVKALSGAKIYTPVGNVTVGPELHVPAYDLGDGVFGDKGNNWASYAIARVTNGATLRWIKYGANNSGDFHWDESKKTYLNADGTVPFTGAGNDVNAWYQWAMSTDLYGKEKNLNPPTPPTIHYQHTNVALEKPTPIDVTYHYDRMNPASIEDRTDISYHYNKISVPIPNPTKKADKEGKTLIAGDESTQHISQYTGVNQKLDKFAVGDAIQYTNDGRLPVSFDLSKWTVTTSNGTNVTAQGKFAQYDKTFEGKKYHVVSWSPTNVSSLKDNETYTLNTILKTLNDGITDGEIDRAVGGGDGVTFGEAHGYDEFNPTTDKAWKEGSQTVNGKIEINEDIAHAKVTMTMPDPAKLANKLSNVAITDNYSKFANLVTVTGANVYENERNATSDYTIVNNNKVVTATRKNPATANGGTVSLVVDFKVNPDVPSGTKLVNSGSGTINTQTVPTPDAQIVTFTQKPTKHWIEGSQVVDGKTYINNDIVTTQVDMNLPDPKQLAKTLSYVSIGDNYRDFADKTVLQSYKVFENGTNVTSQYTITNQDGILQAVRKNAATTPGGKVSLIATFAINHDVKSGTKLTNRGFGRINNHTVDTNTPQIVTFKQDTSKHWVEGSQVVDDKTYINEDMVHGQVTMTLPNKDSLAKALTDVTLVDDYSDYANKVSYVNAQVFENNTDVTSQYNITNAGNKITATRKNPGATPSGSVRLVANFKLNSNLPSGTKLINRGSGRINNNTVNTNEAKILTYVQSTDKHWVEGSQKVDGKTYIDGDTIHGQVTMTLPDKNTLAKALSTVQVIDDYSKFAKMVDYKSAQVLENGKDVTSEYNISNAYGQVVATRKNATATPSGNVTLNVTWAIHKDVPSGTQLVNSGSGRINSHTVPTPDRNIVTYKQDGLKDWINSQGQIVNGKTYIDNDTVHAKLVMTLPDPKALATPLTKVQLDDNYTNFAKLVDYQSAQVLENGTDVTSQYTITNANGHVIATRKDASKTPGGNVEFRVNFKIHTDVPSGTTLMNSGEVTLNSETVPTPTPKIVTYKPDTDKHWVEGSQVVDGKTYIANDVVNGQVTMTLPEPSKLAEKLKHVSVTDDYSKFVSLVDYQSAQVLENGKDVTSLYTITNSNGHVTATRKDASTTPAGKVTLNVHWRIHKDVKSGTQLVNSGNGRINDETVPTPNRNIVTFKQDGLKDWLNSQNQVVNGKTYIDNDTVHAKLAMNLPDPKALATPLTKVQLDDNYSNFAKLVDYVSSQVLENGTDVTSQYNIVNNNGHVIATRKDASKTPGGKVEFKVNFKIHTDVPSGTTLMNSGEVTLNTETIPTPTPNIVTYKPNTDKHWVEGTQVVDGKTYIDNDFVHSQVTMTLPDPTKLAEKLKHVSVTDDYSRFAKMVDYKSAQVLENGKDVTAQYNITNANGKVVATRKDASTTPNGSVTLNVTWRIHTDVKSGTVFVNGGDGRINDETVPTPDRTIVTYKQDTEKHWRDDGGQIVDGKIAINDDVVTARVDMTLPKEENLAKPLDKIQLVDDFSKFANKVTLQAVHVYENGKDVTDQYDIHIENGRVVATRKDASKVYDHTGAANATMKATLKANKTLNVNDLVHTASANVNDSKVFAVNRLAFNRLFARSFITSNLAVTSDDNIKSQIDMAVPTNVDAKTPMTVTSDYSNFAKYVNVKDATVYENGKNVTADYTIKDDKAGHVTAIKKDSSESDGGQVSLVVDYEVNHGIPNGTILENHGSGTLNGQDVPTNTPSITTYTQDTNKHWVEGDQNVDGKIYVNGSTAHAQVSMTLPDQSKLINKLLNVSIDDDYSKFAKLVDYKSAKVLENGKDVTSEYTIKNTNDHVTAVRKDASKTPAGNVQLLVDFEIHKDVKSGTELVNGGSGILNKNTVPTNTPSIWTYTPDGEKHWVLDNNVTDNKIYFSGDKAVAQVSVDLPDASKLATPLNKLVLVDNYSDFADKVKLDSAKVLENGKDVTSEYDLTNKDGKVVATRKDAAKTPSGKAVLVTTFTINNGIENATALHNKGSVTVDSITDEVPDTPIVVFTPKAHKDVELGGDVKGDTENSVDGSLILNGSVVTYPITTSDLPAERAEDITKRVVKDTLDKNAEFVGFKAWIENDKGELEDVTSHYKLDKNGQDLTFTEDSYLLGLYNKDKSKQTHTPIIDLVVKAKGDAQKITNKATVLTNDNVTETNEVSVDTPAKPTPTKVDKNEKGVNIDGKNVLPGSVNNYELTMDLAKFKGIKVTDQDLAKGFYFVDDYPEEALDVDPQTFTYKTVDGKTVKGLSAKVYQSLSEVPENVATALKANGITPSGAFVLISADTPAQFFKDYVETGTNIIVNAPMKVKEGFAGKYQNKAWQLIFGQGEATDIVSNNVPKIDPKKDIVISADNRTSLNNHTIELGQNFDYLLKGGILDKDQGHDIYEYKWIDDYDENHDQYNGQFIAPLTVDVTLKDGTVLKAGTDISNHVSQNIDTKTGSVEFSVDKDFLDKVDFDKSGFAADILMSVKRIKAGEVDNTYTNIINGQKFGSNTVHSTTPEPKDPETPATPKTPETPSVPVAQTQTPATPQPVKMVTSTPAPKTPELPALPQTGEANDTLAEEVVGFAAIVAALGMAGTSLKKRED